MQRVLLAGTVLLSGPFLGRRPELDANSTKTVIYIRASIKQLFRINVAVPMHAMSGGNCSVPIDIYINMDFFNTSISAMYSGVTMSPEVMSNIPVP